MKDRAQRPPAGRESMLVEHNKTDARLPALDGSCGAGRKSAPAEERCSAGSAINLQPRCARVRFPSNPFRLNVPAIMVSAPQP